MKTSQQRVTGLLSKNFSKKIFFEEIPLKIFLDFFSKIFLKFFFLIFINFSKKSFFRSYQEFEELRLKLCYRFSIRAIPSLSQTVTILGRTNVREVAIRRVVILKENFLKYNFCF